MPLVAEEDGPVRRGQVAGYSQVARVFADEREVVRLELVVALDAEDPRDEVELDADPPLRLVVPGGIPGDQATAAAAVNAATAVTRAARARHRPRSPRGTVNGTPCSTGP